MKSVLISIKPRWCELIASGEKTVEIRKTKPGIDTPFKCYIYETTTGKVIGEFVCDRVQSYYCEFTDGGCYEGISSVFVDSEGDEFSYIQWSNEADLPYENTDAYTEGCVRYDELKNYIGLGFKNFYGWHISKLKMYDKPKELSEFGKKVANYRKWADECGKCEFFDYPDNPAYELGTCQAERRNSGICPIKRPPQSWCYVEEADK